MHIEISAQYIGEPKTATFRQILSIWHNDGIVKEWTGSFKTLLQNGEFKDGVKSVRFVGYPSMNSICKELINNSLITCHFGNRVTAIKIENNKWIIRSEANNIEYGPFDWIISGDRLLTLIYSISPFSM